MKQTTKDSFRCKAFVALTAYHHRPGASRKRLR